MIVEVFGKRIQAYLRASGYQQKELATALGVHYKVLSRKLHGTDSSYFTHREIHDVILQLIDWQALTKREDLLDLFAEAEIDPATIFRASEWQEAPLKTLARREAPAATSLDHLTPHHNLPASTGQLIGRSWAVERLQQLLGHEGTRLVTLIGPGGSGKTRLALHVSLELLGTFAQRVWFVPFLGISDPEMVPLAIAQVLNIKSTSNQRPLQSIITYLSRRQALLVLDNLEHLGEASNIVEELLAAAPNLKILVTSRIVLRVPGEHEFSVPPLDLPDLTLITRMDTTTLANYSAIQLFVERARAVLPDFALTRENSELIARICVCVDGLPLALELAAARIKLLPPAILLERLSQARLPLLTRVSRFASKQPSSRHQTLRDTIQWSYDLLSTDEQAWFRRLGIFTEGWTLESFEIMMHEIAISERKSPATSSPLDLLTQLADHSLLARVATVQGYARFSMLSTLREYALERLEIHGETERIRDWHTCYFLGKAEKGEIELRGPRQIIALTRLIDASANLHAALEWSLSRARRGELIHVFTFPDGLHQEVASCCTLSRRTSPGAKVSAHEISLRLATALRACWEWQGALTEARYWLNAALELPIPPGAGPTLLAARARALSEAARLRHLQNDPEQALELASESISIWRTLDDPPGLASALFHRAWTLHGSGEYEAAKSVYQEALELISPHTDKWLYAEILLCQAAAFGFTSDFPQARLCYTRCRQLFEEVGDKAAVADAWKDQGGILLIAGEPDEAIDCLLTSIQICRELDHKQYIATALHWLSFAFGLRDLPDPENASLNSARVQGAAESLMATIGMIHWADTTPFIQAVRQYLRSRVSAEHWQAALNEGRALTLNQALELVARLAKSPTP
ncbi:MAG TPA: tetratricopeptide repeat protein [Ktedonobacteraceae bacterium]